MQQIPFEIFDQADIRVGRVVRAEEFPKARKPAIKLWIDFGEEIGLKQSSAQLTVRYSPETLVGRQVVCVVNFAPRNVADFRSEVLTLGAMVSDKDVVLLRPDEDVPLGKRIE